MISRLLRFGVVGVIGFIIDASVLVLAVEVINILPLPARVISFVIAATVTFILNQRFTFDAGGRFHIHRWISYLATTSVGACINVGIYHLWIISNGSSPTHLVIGTAIGSIVAMLVNFFISSVIVFRPTKPLDLSTHPT